MADGKHHPRQVWKVTSGTESLRIDFSPGQDQRPPTVSLGSEYQAPSRICWLFFSTTSSLVQPTVEFCKGCRSASCPSWWQCLLPCLRGIKFLSRTRASAMACVYQCQELSVEPGAALGPQKLPPFPGWLESSVFISQTRLQDNPFDKKQASVSSSV